MVMNLSAVFLSACVIFSALQFHSTTRDQAANVSDHAVLKSDFWKNVLLRSGDLPRRSSGLVDINEFLVGVIENFREDMITGIPELKVPVLDPFRPPKPIKIDVEDKGELNKALLNVINKHLSKLPIKSILPGSTANEYVDQILSNVRQFITDQNYDPMELPEFQTNFSKEVLFMTMYGEAKLHDGWLSGISSIHRTDECALDSTPRTIAISAHLGLKDLQLSYKGHAKFMNWGPSIECGGSISDVSFFFSVEQSNIRGATPHLRDLQIVEMSTIWIELSGLGPLTWILKWLLTGISKLVEDFIVNKVTEYLKEYLEEEFQKVSFPI